MTARPAWRARLAEHLPTIAAVVLVAGIALWKDLAPNLTIDEAFSLDTARRSLPDAYGRALTFELQPPVYYVLLHLWLLISPTLHWARVLSTLFSVATILVLAQLARDLGARARWMPLVAALSPTVLWTASYTRSYALALLLGAVSTLYAARLILPGDGRTSRNLAGYVVSSYLLLLTFYYSGFLLAGHALAAIVGRQPLKRFAAAAGALCILFLPWVSTVLGQVRQHPVYLPPVTFAGTGIARTWAVAQWVGDWLAQVVTMHSSFVQRPVVAAAIVVLVAAAGIMRFRTRADAASRTDAQWLAMAAVPFVVLVLLRVTNAALVETRYLVVAAVPAIVLLTVLAGGLGSAASRAAWTAGLLGVLGLSCVSYLRNPDITDIAGAARHIEASAGPAEPVFFYLAERELPFRDAFAKPHIMAGLPRPMPSVGWSTAAQTVASEQEAEAFLAAIPRGTKYWVVMGAAERVKPILHGEMVEQAIERAAVVLERRDFGEMTVWHLRADELRH